MQVTKLRASSDANGLVPAGCYFEQLSKNLRAANAREQTRGSNGSPPLQTRAVHTASRETRV